ncbi:efflux RND transporter permease subunit, partial [Enterobacter mori]|uniref:efflux RND transporter permease subunit n=1 Tax=Enterobacter mori TaxID=539813 RepID=UPI003B842E72
VLDICLSLSLILRYIYCLVFLGAAPMPQLQEGSIMFRVLSIPSTSLETSLSLSSSLSEQIRSRFPQVKDVTATIGRAEKGETADVNSMEMLLTMDPADNWLSEMTYQELALNIQEHLKSLNPGVQFSATQPIQMRVEELISGIKAPLALKVYGKDSDVLSTVVEKIHGILTSIPGVSSLSTESGKGKLQIMIRVDREKAARYGISSSEIVNIIESGIGDAKVSSIIEGNARFDLVTRFSLSERNTLEAISAIPLRGAGGNIIQLSQIADIQPTEGYAFLRREGLQRYAVLEMGVEGRDTNSFVQEASQIITQKKLLPAGYWIEWGGVFESQQRAMSKLAVILPLTVAVIFLLLYTAFNSLRHAVLVIANIPFAMTGGIMALFISGQYLSVPSAIGFIAVFGVSVLNGIVMISSFNTLRASGMSLRNTVRQGATQRLRPVLITATVAILGLVPVLLSDGVGAEIQRPLASVVAGGLLTSTLLTLFLLPMFYEWSEERYEKHK